jgi:hypothetical protein
MVKLYRVHFTTDRILITSLWSYNEYTSPRTKFLSHHSEVASSTLYHGHNSYHKRVNLYRVHIARDKPVITSKLSCIEYTLPRTNFFSHHSKVVSSTLRHRQTFYHIIVKLYRVYILRHRQTSYHIKFNLHRVYFFGLFRTGSEHSICLRSMKWFRTFWTNDMLDKLTLLFLSAELEMYDDDDEINLEESVVTAYSSHSCCFQVIYPLIIILLNPKNMQTEQKMTLRIIFILYNLHRVF